MTQSLPHWATELLEALEIQPVEVDLQTLEDISSSLPDESPKNRLMVGFIAGYAAGLAEGGGMASFDRAHAASTRFMRQQLTQE